MSLDMTLTETLENLIGIEPNLLHELRAARKASDAVERIKTVAGRHGIAIDVEALALHLQNMNAHDVADETLGGLAGGIAFPRVQVQPK